MTGSVFLEVAGLKTRLFELAADYAPLPEAELNKRIDEKLSFSRMNLEDLGESIIQNKEDGLRREHDVYEDLVDKYPENKGFTIVSEAYLRNSDGYIVRDPLTDQGRRVDFAVVKNGKVVDMIEVTSLTADKTEQTAKENRIREIGGNYIRTPDGTLAEIPSGIRTRIERRK